MQAVPETSVAPARRSERGEETRRRILDAAELLFADRGYHGVSIRDITQLAGVEAALPSYHFGTKARLFSSVVQRRADEHRGCMLERLAAVQAAAAPGLPSNEALIRAYALPAVENIGRGSGWAAYVKLIVSLHNLASDDEASLLARATFDDIIRRFVDAFVAANPGLPRSRVICAVYFLHGALIHLLSQGQRPEEIAEGVTPLPREDLVEELALLFAAGLSGVGLSAGAARLAASAE